MELAEAAVECHDASAMQLAAKSCVQTASIWNGFDWKRYEWFQLFEAACDISPESIDSLPDPASGMSQTISAQMAVKTIWQVVAQTPLSDLTDVSNRARAWDLIPVDLVNQILEDTAQRCPNAGGQPILHSP